MKKNIIKKIVAFSLVEVLLSMSILSIFIIGTMKVMTVKPTSRKIEYPHGYFECFYDAGVLKQRHFYGNSLKMKKDGGEWCTFEPPAGAAFLNVHIVFPHCNTAEYDEATKTVTYGALGHSYIQAEMQSYANNLVKVKPPRRLPSSQMQFAEFESNGQTIVYDSVVQNISEDSLRKHMILVTQNHTKPEMHDKLANNTLGCISTGIGNNGGVFISW